jgi:hypothetical protein
MTADVAAVGLGVALNAVRSPKDRGQRKRVVSSLSSSDEKSPSDEYFWNIICTKMVIIFSI